MDVYVCVCAHVVCIYVCIIYIYYVQLRMYITVMTQRYIYIYCLGNCVTPTQRRPTLQHPSFSFGSKFSQWLDPGEHQTRRWRVIPRDLDPWQPKFDPTGIGIGLFDPTGIPEFCSKIVQNELCHASHVAKNLGSIFLQRVIASWFHNSSPHWCWFTPFDWSIFPGHMGCSMAKMEYPKSSYNISHLW